MKVFWIFLFFTGVIFAQTENIDTSIIYGTWKLESVGTGFDAIYPERWQGHIDSNLWVLKIGEESCEIYLNGIYYCSSNNGIFKKFGAYCSDSMYCMSLCKFGPGGGGAESYEIYITFLNDSQLSLWDGFADGCMSTYKRQNVSTKYTLKSSKKYLCNKMKRVNVISPKNKGIKNFISISGKENTSYYSINGKKLDENIVNIK
jgi:hypothetical protein